MNRNTPALWLIALIVLVSAGCKSSDSNGVPGSQGPGVTLRLLSGSENKTLQPILDRFARDNNATIKTDYLGSVDIMLKLGEPQLDYDAVWPANRLWIALGDRSKRVKEEQSILWSPVVFGVKKSIAQKLGWVGKPVKVDDILAAAESGNLRFMMTSATQSNSGASAYLGFLYAFAGNPNVLSDADLAKPDVRGKIKRILGAVNRSSGSSGWLKDLFLKRYDSYDAMVNYESVVIEANQELIKQGEEPLYVVYPSDGLAIADSPLAYIDQGDSAKSDLFRKLQAYLLSAEGQRAIQAQGRRVGPVGEEIQNADTSVFNPDWGIDVKKFLNQIRYPKAEVIRSALDLYQSTFRKPSLTVYCLDFSGSMERENREEDLKSAMRLVLDQATAKKSFLQASPNDITTVIAFSNEILATWTVKGNDPAQLSGLWQKINQFEPQGGTDIYSPVMRAIDLLKQTPNLENYFPAVILLTDGESNTGASLEEMQAHLRAARIGADVPVFGILFGEASENQLNGIAQATSGRVFDPKGDLTKAFREVKGYN
jgi:Ca-activated chloride channel homolog